MIDKRSVEYLNRTVHCKIAPSQLHGVGVFAIHDIEAGTKLTDFGLSDIFYQKKNNIYSLAIEDFMELLPEVRELILDRQILDADYSKDLISFVSPNNDAALQSYMNHSDHPNSDGEYALRDIKKGEEITEDFRKIVLTLHPLSKEHYSFL